MATEDDRGAEGEVARAEAAARALAAAPDVEAGQDAARALMAEMYALGLRARVDPAFRASPRLRGLVQRTAPLVARGLPSLAYWLVLLESRFHGTWEWSWSAAVRARSSLAFLRALYRGTAVDDAEDVESLETGEIDDQLRHVARFEGWMGDDAVPPGIPASHWWWWAPQEPPPHRAAGDETDA